MASICFALSVSWPSEPRISSSLSSQSVMRFVAMAEGDGVLFDDKARCGRALVEKNGIRVGTSLVNADLRSEIRPSAGVFLVASQPMPTPISKTAATSPTLAKALENLPMLSSIQVTHHTIKPSRVQIEVHKVCNKSLALESIPRGCRFRRHVLRPGRLSNPPFEPWKADGQCRSWCALPSIVPGLLERRAPIRHPASWSL